MKLLQTIRVDFANRGVTQKIYGKQDDSGSKRGVRVELFNSGVSYEVEKGTTFLMRYKTAQCAVGMYDALPNGSSAFEFEAGKNWVIVYLVDQMFAVPGDVECELRVVAPDGLVTTWTWILDVERGNVEDASIPSDYINAFAVLAENASKAAYEAETNAKAAAESALSVNANELMHYGEYDALRSVKAAGGIDKYVGKYMTENINSLIPVENVDAGLSIDSYEGLYSIEILNQSMARWGNIGIINFTIQAGLQTTADASFSFVLSGLPDIVAVFGSAATGTVAGFADAYVKKLGYTQANVRVTYSNNSGGTFRLALICIFDD